MQTQHLESDNTLKKMIAVSAIFHLIVLCLFVVRLRYVSNETLIFQSAVRVDLVGLPAKNIPEQVTETPESSEPTETVEPIREKASPAKAQPKEAAVDLKKKQSTAIEKLKALQAIEDLKRVEETKRPNAPPIKGNVISPGSAIKGLARGEYDAYIGKIDSHIKQSWLLPEWLAKAGHRTRILVKFDERGVVLERKIILTSGNSTYDEAAMKAVDAASPFPAPPDRFVKIVAIDGIIFQFPD